MRTGCATWVAKGYRLQQFDVVDALAINPHLALVAQALEVLGPGEGTWPPGDDVLGPRTHLDSPACRPVSCRGEHRVRWEA